MRITADEKRATRRRSLNEASKLFRTRGFKSTTTRDIAVAAGIATGTLFNYFPNKEAIVAFFDEEAVTEARASLERQDLEAKLEEDLFANVAAELRQLKPLRTFIMPLLETSLSPLTSVQRSESNDFLRVQHLETVAGLVRKHGFPDLSPVTLQVYWTLYLGVLAFWAGDKSPKQEDSLALLDQSITMFVAWLCNEHKKNS